CRTEQCRLGTADNTQRYSVQECGEAAFTAKGLAEQLALQQWEDAWRNATSEIDTAGRQHLERQISCLCAEDGNKDRQRSHRDLWRVLPHEGRIDDDRRGVVCAGHAQCQVLRLCTPSTLTQVGVDVRDPHTARANAFTAYMIIPGKQVAK